MIWLYIARMYIGNTGAPDRVWFFPIWLVDFQRQTIWAFTLEIWENAPWFGIGPNTINYLPGANAPLPGDKNLQLIPGHPHNWMFELLAETGAIGLTLITIAIFLFGIYWLKKYSRDTDLGTLCLLLIYSGYWGSGLFNFSYWSAWWQLSYFVASAIALSLAKRDKPEL